MRPMRSRRRVAGMRSRLLAVLSLCSPLPAAAAGFTALDLPGSQLTALSEDGRVAAGSLAGSDSGGFRWQRDRGAQPLPHAVSVHGISPSGRHVAGSSLDENANEVATWWDLGGDAHRIDALPRDLGSPSVGHAIDDDARLSGVAHGRDDRHIAFSWTAADGLRVLGPAATRVPAACPGTGAPGASAELPAPIEFGATSRDGALRVGHAGGGGQRRAIVWAAHGGTQRLDTFLAANGVEVPDDWTLVAATAVSADARRIGGYGLHRHHFDSFIAELPANVRVLCDSSTPPTASQRRDGVL